ncbi:two-component system sensor histidine kinase VanS [Anaerotaenia torta]|uniref:sensor histidine kinase n=1 Tax=Anaerotaenia torta TaxID=433293 RepID=UPI003D1DE011
MKNNQFHSKFIRKTILRCIMTIILVTVLYVIGVVLVYYLASRIVWQPTPLYYFLKTIERHFTFLLLLVWFLTVAIIVYIDWSKTVGYIVEIADASAALVQPEEKDIQLSEELREIEYRMNQIKRIALQNERDAREAEQRKNDLVVNLAHDIRTPLASVIGYLSLLDEAPDMPAEQRIKYTGITLEKAFRLEQLIEEFFEITRFNLSSILVNKGKINLSFMLRQIADEFYPMLSPQSKQTAVHVPEGLILWGDADKLSRVFNNILKNAVAYSYEGSVIDITAFEDAENTVIQFANTGDPIPPQKLETIFERFFRLDSARSSQTGGAGLGLAIAKEIVTAHGGTIAAQCEEDRTTFTVTLPKAAKTVSKNGA